MWEILKFGWPILILLIPFAFPAFISFLMLFLARIEKISVREFVPFDSCASLEKLPPYHAEMNRQAKELGYTSEGTVRHWKHDIIVSLWLSSDHLSLLKIGSGRMARMKVRSSFLTSELDEGRWLETRDVAEAPDLSGRIDWDFLFNADMHELTARHAERLAENEAKPIAIRPGDAVPWLDAFALSGYERLIEMGYAKYVDPARAHWKYTWRGAYRMATRNFGQQRRLVKSQAKRARLKRPGEKGYLPRPAPTDAGSS